MNNNNASLQEQQQIFSKYLTPAMADTILNLADGVDVTIAPNEKGVDMIHFSRNNISCGSTRYLQELMDDWSMSEEERKDKPKQIKHNVYKINATLTARCLRNPQLAEHCDDIVDMIQNEDFSSVMGIACSLGNYENIVKQANQLQLESLTEFIDSIEAMRGASKVSNYGMNK